MANDLKEFLIERSHDPRCIMEHSERATYALLVMPEDLQRAAGKDVLEAMVLSVATAMDAAAKSCNPETTN